MVISLLCILFTTNLFAADYDFVYNAYGNVKLYCKITKAATSTKTTGRGEVTIVGGTGPAGSEVFIDLVSNNGYDYRTTAIAAEAFDGATWIGKLYLQGYEKSVGDYAFRGCTGITYLSINQTSVLGKGEFYGCTGLTSVTIPQTITTIPDYCFYGCSNLKTLQIGRDVQTIGVRAFFRCSLINGVVVPENVTYVGEYCFGNSGTGGSIEIRCNVNNGAFLGMCFYYVTLAETIKSFDVNSFSCPSMNELRIYSDAVTNQDYDSNKNLITASLDDNSPARSVLQKVVIGGNVKAIGSSAFRTPGGIQWSVLHTLKIEEGVESIGEYTFAGHESLGNVSLPSTITSIDGSAFSMCRGLGTIYMPKNLAYFGPAYSYCDNVRTIFAETANGVNLLAMILEYLKEDAKVYAFSEGIYQAYVAAGFKHVYLVGGSGSGSTNDEDVNNDGKVNATDAMLIYNYILSH